VSTTNVAAPIDVEAATRRLFEAQRDRREIEPLTDTWAFDERTAYEIQKKLVAKQVEHESTRVVGLKLGLTSEAKQKQMGVHEPIYGLLLGSRYLGEGEALVVSSLIHPKVEPEIAVFTAAPLAGPGVTADQARKAIAFATPAMEVIDSRYKDFRFTLTDVIADNTSAARFVIASRRIAAASVDLRTVGVVFEKNGEVVSTAAGAAILGDPAEAVAWLANKLAEHGESLAAGTTIMAGSLTDAVSVAPGDILTVTIAQLGSLTLRCV